MSYVLQFEKYVKECISEVESQLQHIRSKAPSDDGVKVGEWIYLLHTYKTTGAFKLLNGNVYIQVYSNTTKKNEYLMYPFEADTYLNQWEDVVNEKLVNTFHFSQDE